MGQTPPFRTFKPTNGHFQFNSQCPSGHYRGMKPGATLAPWRAGHRGRLIFGAVSPEFNWIEVPRSTTVCRSRLREARTPNLP